MEQKESHKILQGRIPLLSYFVGALPCHTGFLPSSTLRLEWIRSRHPRLRDVKYWSDYYYA